MKNLIRKIYWKIPFQFWLEYKDFSQITKLICETEYLSKDMLRDYQLMKLKGITQFAYNNTNGYKQLFKENSVHPNDLQQIEDLKYFPFVTKEILRDNLNDFSVKKNINMKYETTGGSTGIPFGFYLNKSNYYQENAFIWDIWKQRLDQNTKYPQKSVILRGVKHKKLSFIDGKDGLYLSAYDICQENIETYIKQIEKYRYPFFQAYPSAAYLFAKEIDALGLTFKHQFSSLMLGSEPLYEHQKNLLKKVFKAPICHWYGQSEKVVLGGNCFGNDKFHIYPQYGYTEILNNIGDEIKTGEIGEIVGTSFLNFATPLIRYKTYDLARKGANYCPHCKKEYLILDSIEGRMQELIVGKSGKLVSMTAINMHNNIFDEIKQFRFIQFEEGKIIFKYIKNLNFNSISLSKIKEGLSKKIGDEFDITFEETKEIPPSANGKYKFLDQHLDLKNYEYEFK